MGQVGIEACKSPIDGAGAIDYFVLPTRDAKYLRDIPPFITGNWRWDNVVLALALTLMNLPSGRCHEDGDRLHQGREKVVRREERPASAHNHGLAVRCMGKAYRRGSINCAEYESHYGKSLSETVLVRRKENHLSVVCKHRDYGGVHHATKICCIESCFFSYCELSQHFIPNEREEHVIAVEVMLKHKRLKIIPTRQRIVDVFKLIIIVLFSI